jgi:hypothetical protein
MANDRELLNALVVAGENYALAVVTLLWRGGDVDGAPDTAAHRAAARTKFMDAVEAVYLATKRRS